MAEKVELTEFTRTERAPRPPKERTEEQKSFDADVFDAYDNGTVLAYQVEATEEATKKLENQVRNSVDHLDLGARQGKVLPGKKKGYVILQWKIVPRTRKPRKPKETSE